MMISERRGPIPGTDARCTLLILASRSAIRRTSWVLVILGLAWPLPRALSLFARVALASANAAAVPEVATTRLTRGFPSLRWARCSSRSIYCFNRAMSCFAGGSPRRNSCCSRTAPSGRLTISRIRPWSESVTSQLPPPRSISTHRPLAPGSCVTTPRWISRPSSSPEITSTFQPVADFTHAVNAAALRASRMALVATTRTRSATCS